MCDLNVSLKQLFASLEKFNNTEVVPEHFFFLKDSTSPMSISMSALFFLQKLASELQSYENDESQDCFDQCVAPKFSSK